MVNEKQAGNTRSHIISILKEAHERASGPISGETMAARLGISRVAVWKAIRTLASHGYEIESSAEGYSLKKESDTELFPWDFGFSESDFSWKDSASSTMTIALDKAISGAKDGYVVAAGDQSEGRGTQDKKWASPRGGLYFTRISRPPIHPQYAHRFILACQCAMVESLRALGAKDAFASWPNDIYVRDTESLAFKKAGGILGEYLVSGNALSFINVGIGINTESNVALEGAASIPLSKRTLLAEYLSRAKGDSFQESNLAQKWRSLSRISGKKIRFRSGSSLLTGTFTGIDELGNALIHDSQQSITRTYLPGTITILEKERI